jgi:hypothetical protein
MSLSSDQDTAVVRRFSGLTVWVQFLGRVGKRVRKASTPPGDDVGDLVFGKGHGCVKVRWLTSLMVSSVR